MFSIKRCKTAIVLFLQYSRFCICGNSYGSYGPAASDDECNMGCSGDSTIMCGGGFRNSVYRISTSAGTSQGCTHKNAANLIAIRRPC